MAENDNIYKAVDTPTNINNTVANTTNDMQFDSDGNAELGCVRHDYVAPQVSPCDSTDWRTIFRNIISADAVVDERERLNGAKVNERE